MFNQEVGLCLNGLCPSRKKCMRYTVKKQEFKTYNDFKFKEGESKCKFFILKFEHIE